MVFDVDGWYQWQTDQAGGRAYIHEGIVYSPRNGQVRRFQLADGTPLAPFPGTTTASVAMAFHGSNMYWAELVAGSLQVTALSLQGVLVWDVQLPIDPSYRLRTIAVDVNGRPWCVLGTYDENSSDIVVRIEMDGTTSATYSHGHRINDLATDGGRIYLTGQLDQNTSETFLIAVDASLPTGIAGAANESFRLWPNPAQEVLNLGGDLGEWAHARIHDPQGRLIRNVMRTDLSTIAVHDLEQGAYFLSLLNGVRVVTLPFMITR
jgi:hypothetical protein